MTTRHSGNRLSLHLAPKAPADMTTPDQFKVECWPPRQTGGQVVGSGPCGVKVTHIPTGAEAVSIYERSQHKNKMIAKEMIEWALAAYRWTT